MTYSVAVDSNPPVEMLDNSLLGVSLFSGAGIGDLGFRASGVRFIAACELEPDRSALGLLNFPEAAHFAVDISADAPALARKIAKLVPPREEVFLVACTAPCQGMSKSGKGTLLNNIRKGNRPALDPRNRLILPGLQIIRHLNPRWVVFENVCEMRNTVIEDEQGNLRLILDIIRDTLGHDYVGEAYDVEMADYGIPQRRQRLITVFTRDPNSKAMFARGARLIPRPTHSKQPSGIRTKWVSVAEALRDLPPLDGRDGVSATDPLIPFHRVPVLDPKKYEWIRHTPLGASAFDNQCISPQCGFTENLTHGATHGVDGINRANVATPLYCQKCGNILPRPSTPQSDGTLRIMKGFTSAYKRMRADLPAPAITRNLSYPCSDHKIHPTQNRVLSLAEAMVLQSISDYAYQWGPILAGMHQRKKDIAPDGLIRLVIGESVPPRFLEMLGTWIQELSNASDSAMIEEDSIKAQLDLLSA